MKFLIILLFVPLLVSPVFGQLNSQILPTDKGTLNVDFSISPASPSPGDIVKLNIDFINPTTGKTQEHIDYRVTVTKDGIPMFGPIPLTHTSVGKVSIPVELGQEGTYQVTIDVEGILFQPIPPESVSFDISVGQEQTQSNEGSTSEEGGGCLIATATYGSELAPQVQQLRELRDHKILKTSAGTSFMKGFNQLYYLFSPTIADWERQNPTFKEFIKLSITPMMSTLAILNSMDIDSEEEVLGYGIGIILLNIGMYIGLPAFAILKLYQFKRK